MNIVVDFHCHIYALYDLPKVLKFGAHKLGCPLGVFLTERSDCSFFDDLIQKKIELPAEFKLEAIDSNCIKINQKYFIFRGRQYATKEGIEVLSLFASPKIEDRLPAKVYCEEIIKQGGLIAFSWAFGKWRAGRSNLIEELALEFGSSSVILLDSRLRPQFLKLPKVFERLSSKGFKVYGGSDPLPLAWHENALGNFGNIFELADTDLSEINSDLIRDIIFNKKSSALVGERSGAFQFLKDQLALRIPVLRG